MQVWVIVALCSLSGITSLTSALLIRGPPLLQHIPIQHITVQEIHPTLLEENHDKNPMNPINYIDVSDKGEFLNLLTPIVLRASSNMHKTMTHTKVKHITKGDSRVAVITKMTEHSHSNIVHSKPDHPNLKSVHPNKIEDLTAKVVFSIAPHTSSVGKTFLPLANVIDTEKLHNHLHQPLYVANAFSSHDNLVDLRDHKSEIDHNTAHENMDISPDIGVNVGNHLEADDNKHVINRVTGFVADTNINSKNVITEHEIKDNHVFRDYEANAYRHPVGGFGAGLKFGGHGAGHGYFGFHGR